uniref:SPIN-DOC-like zinc-finger domain-containing protein n=1 Tax=Gasterosteus aculeatus aculeatus TaxID=481459 RepID=A0AAQ4RIH8_GASAC
MAEPKKRKIASECRKFQTRWGNEYFFKEVKEKCVCLICNETVAVMKESNVRRHYETKHPTFTSYTAAEREDKVQHMAANLQAQQQYFYPANNTQENATIASYEVAQLIARRGKAFSDGDFVKQCLIKVAGIMCPEKMQEFNNVSMSTNTIVRRIEDLSANIQNQVSHKACAFDFYSIACDESTDATDAAQLFISLRGVDDNFCITEELLDLRSLKGTTMGKDIFEAVSGAIDKMELKWDKLRGGRGSRYDRRAQRNGIYGVRQGAREWRRGCKIALYHPTRSSLCQDSPAWRCDDHSCENCQHNSSTRALPQRIKLSYLMLMMLNTGTYSIIVMCAGLVAAPC